MKHTMHQTTKVFVFSIASLLVFMFAGDASVRAQQKQQATSSQPQMFDIAPPPGAPKSIFPASASELKKIVTEDTYFFKVQTFTPNVRVKFVNRKDASYSTPEASTIARVSAMAASDFQWFRETWTELGKAQIDDANRLNNRPPEFWSNVWSKTLMGKSFELTHRIETGEYVLIAYRAIGAGAGGKDLELVQVMKKEGDRWLATQDLARDPILNYWRKPDEPIKRVMRTAVP